MRALSSSQGVRRDDIDGPRYNRGSQERARLKSDAQLRLPTVTFTTLPLLTEARSGQTSPQDVPMRAIGSVTECTAGSIEGIHAVEQHPHHDTGGDASKQRDEGPNERSIGPAPASIKAVPTRTAQDDGDRHND